MFVCNALSSARLFSSFSISSRYFLANRRRLSCGVCTSSSSENSRFGAVPFWSISWSSSSLSISSSSSIWAGTSVFFSSDFLDLPLNLAFGWENCRWKFFLVVNWNATDKCTVWAYLAFSIRFGFAFQKERRHFWFVCRNFEENSVLSSENADYPLAVSKTRVMVWCVLTFHDHEFSETVHSRFWAKTWNCTRFLAIFGRLHAKSNTTLTAQQKKASVIRKHNLHFS